MDAKAMAITLKSLKLHGMAHAVDEMHAQGSPAYQSAQPILGALIKAEMAEREVRSLAYQMKVVRFPMEKRFFGCQLARWSRGSEDQNFHRAAPTIATLIDS